MKIINYINDSWLDIAIIFLLLDNKKIIYNSSIGNFDLCSFLFY